MRCIIHIGPAKTGTTTIQAFLDSNRDAFRRHGVYVPKGRHRPHDELLILSLQKVILNRALGKWGIRNQDDLVGLQEQLRSTVQNWLAEAREFGIIVFSQEGLAGRSKPEIATIKKFLSAACKFFTIVAFLRRQDLWLNSVHKNTIKNKGLPIGLGPSKGPDYFRMLDKWASVFSVDAVRPGVFPDSTPDKTDLISDFLSIAELSADETFERPETKNVAWDARGVEILDALNEYIPPVVDGRVLPERRLLEIAIPQAFPERRSFRMPIDRAKAVCANRESSNSAVAQRWFKRDKLFRDDFSMYSAEPAPPAGTKDYARVIAEIARLAVARKA